VRHKAVRVWFKPWKKRCSCGCPWFPCPDAATVPSPPVSQSLRLGPAWNTSTARYATVGRSERPLMTRGQEWRSRRTDR
jgi:hypothetical protein